MKREIFYDIWSNICTSLNKTFSKASKHLFKQTILFEIIYPIFSKVRFRELQILNVYTFKCFMTL